MEYKIDEVFEMLSSYGLTRNIQVLRRWIREGKLKATYIEPNNRKIGQVVKEEDFYNFLEIEAPGVLLLIKQNKALKEEIKALKGTSTVKNAPANKKTPKKPKKEEFRTISLTKTEIRKLNAFNKEIREKFVTFLFRDIKRRGKVEITLPTNQSLSDYLGDLMANEEFIDYTASDTQKEAYRRAERGEITFYVFHTLYSDIVKKQRYVERLGITDEAPEIILKEKIKPLCFDDSTGYTNLKRDDKFIDPETEEAFDTIVEAIERLIQFTYTEIVYDKQLFPLLQK